MKRRFLLVFVAFMAAATAFAQNDLQPLAIVKLNKSETITLKTLKTRVNFIQKQYDAYGVKLTAKERLEVLESLIDEKLIVQAAAKENLTITDSQVNQAFLSTFSQQLGRNVTESELESLIKEQTKLSLNDYLLQNTGMGTSDYKTYLKNQLIVQQYVYTKKQQQIVAVAATDKEIRDFYDLNKSSFIWNDMLRLYLVIVPKGSDATAAKALCTQLRNQYNAAPSTAGDTIAKDTRNGKNFQAGTIVVQKTSAQAAQLGWDMNKIVELFEKKVGTVSEVSETSSDFQFYAVQKKYVGKMLSLSDIVQPETTVTVYDYIKQNLTVQKQQQYFSQAAQEVADSLDTTANVERKKTGADLTSLLSW